MYDVQTNPVIVDLNAEIQLLQQDKAEIEKDMEKVRPAYQKGHDLENDIKASLRKEILESEQHMAKIDEWISYLKLQRKHKFAYLHSIRKSEDIEKIVEEDKRQYFLQKKLKPINRTWIDRYRTAIEL